MSNPENWQKKCDRCGKWSDGNKYACEHCGEIMEEELLDAKVKREKETKFDIAWVKIDPNEPFLVRAFKRVVLTVQFIYFSFLSFFISLIAFLSS